jgi:hypothetical protein
MKKQPVDLCYGSLADMTITSVHVRFATKADLATEDAH